MKSFALEIVTPDHVFYNGPSESITVETPSGRMGVLCNHEPVVAPLSPGEIDVRIDGRLRRAVTSGGFLEVLGERVYMFAQSIEWVDEIDVQRAVDAFERAKRHLEEAKKEHNKYEMQRHIWALERAQTRLNILNENGKASAAKGKNGKASASNGENGEASASKGENGKASASNGENDSNKDGK